MMKARSARSTWNWEESLLRWLVSPQNMHLSGEGDTYMMGNQQRQGTGIYTGIKQALSGLSALLSISNRSRLSQRHEIRRMNHRWLLTMTYRSLGMVMAVVEKPFTLFHNIINGLSILGASLTGDFLFRIIVR